MSRLTESSAKGSDSGGCDRTNAADRWPFEVGGSLPGNRRVIVQRTLTLMKALLTNGSTNQAFISAKWLVILLRLTPRSLKRNVALRILSISPHYFYRSLRAEYAGMPTNQFLEAEFERNRVSRQVICDRVLLPHLKSNYQVLEIGCGPGFLAKAVARHVKAAYACDISIGVLECCRIINGAANIKYIYSGESGFAQIPNFSLNLAYSFAVIQHLREAVIRSLFEVASKKLRAGGLCLFQIHIDDGRWKSESAWTDDQSVIGRFRLRYALNFFPRTEDFLRHLAAETGFAVVAIRPMSELLNHPFDALYHQHLLILSKL
jgi:SAM-dependent methyltransferase